MNFDWPFFWHYLFEPSSLYLNGLLLTVVLSVVSQVIGTALGLAAALARISPMRPVRAAARFYIWIMRGTPLLVQIVFIYTGFAAANILKFHDWHLGLVLIAGNVQAGILALSLNEGAYMAEIIRAGIASVDHGQTEAARSLGMTNGLLMRRIILPQALRLIIPPLGNQFNIMLKNSTLVSIIGVPELLLVTETINSATFRTCLMSKVTSRTRKSSRPIQLATSMLILLRSELSRASCISLLLSTGPASSPLLSCMARRTGQTRCHSWKP